MNGVKELTKKELEVLLLICKEGLSYEEIAEKLFISKRTALTHVHKIFKKTGLNSRAEIIWSFYNGGLSDISTN